MDNILFPLIVAQAPAAAQPKKKCSESTDNTQLAITSVKELIAEFQKKLAVHKELIKSDPKIRESYDEFIGLHASVKNLDNQAPASCASLKELYGQARAKYQELRTMLIEAERKTAAASTPIAPPSDLASSFGLGYLETADPDDVQLTSIMSFKKENTANSHDLLKAVALEKGAMVSDLSPTVRLEAAKALADNKYEDDSFWLQLAGQNAGDAADNPIALQIVDTAVTQLAELMKNRVIDVESLVIKISDNGLKSPAITLFLAVANLSKAIGAAPTDEADKNTPTKTSAPASEPQTIEPNEVPAPTPSAGQKPTASGNENKEADDLLGK
jgi:hypothetical protein